MRSLFLRIVGGLKSHIMLVPFYNIAALQKNTHLHIKISSAFLKKHLIKQKKEEKKRKND